MIAWKSHMAKVCDITKKGSIMGGGYSNVVRATKFNPTGMVRKYPNLQKKRMGIEALKVLLVRIGYPGNEVNKLSDNSIRECLKRQVKIDEKHV